MASAKCVCLMAQGSAPGAGAHAAGPARVSGEGGKSPCAHTQSSGSWVLGFGVKKLGDYGWKAWH